MPAPQVDIVCGRAPIQSCRCISPVGEARVLVTALDATFVDTGSTSAGGNDVAGGRTIEISRMGPALRGGFRPLSGKWPPHGRGLYSRCPEGQPAAKAGIAPDPSQCASLVTYLAHHVARHCMFSRATAYVLCLREESPPRRPANEAGLKVPPDSDICASCGETTFPLVVGIRWPVNGTDPIRFFFPPPHA